MIRVKFSTGGLNGRGFPHWRRQLPDASTRIGGCEFLLDVKARDYDWLVVYDDLPKKEGERFSSWTEALPCPRERTMLFMREPSSIKLYGKDYLNQFGHIISSQEPWAIPHPRHHYEQPALRWFYGAGDAAFRTLDGMRAETFPDKAGLVSTVCSAKQQGHTLHEARYEFTFRLKQDLPELEIFGRGVRPIADKADALDAYRYHIAVENHVAEHHWTEKLADSFLGWTVPFYHGAPNAADYFPADSFIPIDIGDYEGSLRIIREELASGRYESRKAAVAEARRRVLDDYNIFAVAARKITSLQSGPASGRDEKILARHALRKRPLVAVSFFFESLKAAAHRRAERRKR
jgi:hypothetical protein